MLEELTDQQVLALTSDDIRANEDYDRLTVSFNRYYGADDVPSLWSAQADLVQQCQKEITKHRLDDDMRAYELYFVRFHLLGMNEQFAARFTDDERRRLLLWEMNGKQYDLTQESEQTALMQDLIACRDANLELYGTPDDLRSVVPVDDEERAFRAKQLSKAQSI